MKIKRQLLKEIIKKSSLLSRIYRIIREIAFDIKRIIFEFPNSTQNIKFTNFVSQKRLGFSQNVYYRSIKDILNSEVSTYPYLNISIVTFNNGKWLDTFFNGLLKQNFDTKKIRLFFVDNSSTDDTYKLLEEYKKKFNSHFDEINLFQIENKGFGYGHNYAIQKIKDDYVLVSNVDLEFKEDALINLIKFIKNDVDKEQVACYELMQRPYEHPKYYDPISFETAWCSHACILIDIRKYKEIGGYHKHIFMYGEDVELSYRFRAYGYKLKYVPISAVNHYSYDEPNKPKKLQFLLSKKANFLLRMAYGNRLDKFVGYLLQIGLLLHGGRCEIVTRKDLLKNFLEALKDKKYFLNFKDNQKCYFPFSGFEYEKSKKGAFYNLIEESREIPNEKLPLVSIITRTYKGREKLLAECITSVLNQTYINIEHIIVEDGGDTMIEMIENYKQKHFCNNIRYYAYPKKGRSYIGNKGLENAKGKYCLFLDDDDLIFPDHIDVLVNALLKNKYVRAAYSLSWEVLTNLDNNNDKSYCEKEYRFNKVFEQEFSRDTLLEYNYIPIQCILFERGLFNEYGGFDEELEQLEDWNLWCKYAMVSDFKFVNKLTSLYRTPYNKQERNKRAAKLDSVYHTAMKKQQELAHKLGKN